MRYSPSIVEHRGTAENNHGAHLKLLEVQGVCFKETAGVDQRLVRGLSNSRALWTSDMYSCYLTANVFRKTLEHRITWSFT